MQSRHLPLPAAFFERDARVVARALVGVRLIRSFGDERAGGGGEGEEVVTRIVETEAYRGPTDAACHARFGLTPRTRALFAAPGHAYVFLIYGMYECFNVTCLREGSGHAVLVRGVEPVTGMATGLRTDGPGRLTRALGITRAEFDGVDLCGSSTLFLAAPPAGARRARIATSARVGVAYAGPLAEKPWRFYDATSPHVSRPSAKTIGLGMTPASAGRARR